MLSAHAFLRSFFDIFGGARAPVFSWHKRHTDVPEGLKSDLAIDEGARHHSRIDAFWSSHRYFGCCSSSAATSAAITAGRLSL